MPAAVGVDAVTVTIGWTRWAAVTIDERRPRAALADLHTWRVCGHRIAENESATAMEQQDFRMHAHVVVEEW